MSESHRQQPFGQPTFTDGPASGNSSGRDQIGLLDVTSFYHNEDEDNEYSGVGLHALQIPASHHDFAHVQQFAYAAHGDASYPGMHLLSI